MASQLEGVEELTGKLVELGVQLAARELKGTLKDALQLAEHRARSRIPHGTEPHLTYRGRLVSPGYAVSTLHIETGLNKRSGAAFAILGVGREAFYAVQFVDLGTAHMPANPWLRSSFTDSDDAMLKQVAESLRTRVEKTAKSAARARQRGRLARR